MNSRRPLKKDINLIRISDKMDQFRKYPVFSPLMLFNVLCISVILFGLRPSREEVLEFNRRRNSWTRSQQGQMHGVRQMKEHQSTKFQSENIEYQEKNNHHN